MLSFEHVSYRYQGAADCALTDVSLSVAPGEHVVLLGGNGSGKSTLARLANGLLLPEEGVVRVDERLTSEKATIRELRSQVGVISQDPDNQIVSATVLDEVAFGPENLGLERVEILQR
ncbi:MAG: ATP-binding cassette domain-containing protein, partial [Coriobacteriales bacterium]|nr:ATP-binding cassette domain-containing protein [Coriobacteriales bacterium]